MPEAQAVDLPDNVSDDVGASLGIPGITSYTAVMADGPVAGKVVLVNGVLGAVSRLAAQLAFAGGATVIGTVRNAVDALEVVDDIFAHVVALDAPDPSAMILEDAPAGVDRIIEVAFSANVDLDARVVAQGAVIASYASPEERPRLPYWPLAFANVTIRLLGSDDFPAEAKREAAQRLTEAGAAGQISIPIAGPYALEDIAAAHEAVERGGRDGRVLLSLTDG